MLEPRRLAARAAAHRMADQLHESVGETIGYRMRFDTKIGPRTRLEVVTEGVLTRLLQEDPTSEVSCSITKATREVRVEREWFFRRREGP